MTNVSAGPVEEVREQIELAIMFYGCSKYGQTQRGQRQIAALRRYAKSYISILRRLSVKPRKSAFLVPLALHCSGGRALALLRVGMARGYHQDLDRIEKKANHLQFWSSCIEPVTARWITDGSMKVRLLGIPGPIRTAMSLMLRDVLVALGVDSGIDLAKKGAGGEREYIRGITKRMAQGYKFWATPDVTNFFPSIRPGHLQELPINAGLICNVAFLNEETKIKAKFIVSEIKDVKDTIKCKYPELVDPLSPMDIHSIRSISAKALQQGLVPGSVLSPLLARWFLSEAVKQTGLSDNLYVQSYVDDLAIGGKNKIAVESGVNMLAEHLSQRPAGAIYLHDKKVQHRRCVDALGYRLQHGRGHGKNPVHVKPGPKRIERFKRRLEVAMVLAKNLGFDTIKAGLKYWEDWYGSQGAWTKVPTHTKSVSETITITYIGNFHNGEPYQLWAGNFSKVD